MEFVNSLALWHVLLPLAVAALFLLVQHRNPDLGRTVAVAGAVVSLLLAVCLVVAFLMADTPTPATTDSGPPFAGLTLSPYVDGVNLWFLVSIPLVVLCVLLAEPVGRWQSLPISGLLVAESAALAVFTTRDVVMISVSFGVLAIANSVVVGSRGGVGIRATARALLLQQTGATLLITIGLVGTVVACSHMHAAARTPPQLADFNLDSLITEVRNLTRQVGSPPQVIWRQLAPWLFLSLGTGCLVWTGAFPFHVSATAALREGGLVGRALLGGITLKTGAWVLLRVALPLFPTSMSSLGLFLLLWTVLSALYCAVSLYGSRIDPTHAAALGVPSHPESVPPFAAEGAIVFVLLSMCGVLTQTAAGIVGAALLLAAHMVCWMLYVLQAGDARESAADAPPENEVERQSILVVLALGGMPGLALYPGLLLMFLGISLATGNLAGGLALLLLYWLVIGVSAWAFLGRARALAGTHRHWPLGVCVVAALLIGTTILMGVAPGILTGPIYDGVIESMRLR